MIYLLVSGYFERNIGGIKVPFVDAAALLQFIIK